MRGFNWLFPYFYFPSSNPLLAHLCQQALTIALPSARLSWPKQYFVFLFNCNRLHIAIGVTRFFQLMTHAASPYLGQSSHFFISSIGIN